MKRFIRARNKETKKLIFLKEVIFDAKGTQVYFTKDQELAMDVPIFATDLMLTIASTAMQEDIHIPYSIPMSDFIRDSEDIKTEIMHILHCKGTEPDRNMYDCQLDCDQCEAQLGRRLDDYWTAFNDENKLTDL